MRVAVLGPLEVTRGGAQVPLARAQERRLLAALAVHLGRSVSSDALVESLWPGDEQPAQPARALRTIVSRLRDRIGDERVVTTPAGYRLAIPEDALDASRFESLAAKGTRPAGRDPALAVAVLDEALGLWRGGAYQEFAAEPFAQAEAVRLEELRVAANEARIDARLALGDHQELVAEIRSLVARYRFSERLHHQLAVALYRSGRQTEAVASLQGYRRLLAEELGLEPSPSLRDLEWRVLNHMVPAPAPHSPSAPVTADGGSSVDPARSRRLEEGLGLPGTRLIGRTDTIAIVREALRETRLVTLIGPGGVGKTRLAVHVAGGEQARFADGVAVCALAPVREASSVPASVATALDVRQRQHRSLEESLIETLARRQLLLVLDNCEHVVDVAAELVALVLARCPHVTVLATSRERLGLTGEHVIDVPPLTVPDQGSPEEAGSAVELFRVRAQAGGAAIDSDSATIGAVREICRRLDGLPLAIELAAAQVRALHPRDLVAQLAASAPVEARLRDLDERHRSMEAVTEWSYELLSEPEKELFTGLSVFAGSFGWQAVERVAVEAGLPPGHLVDLLNAIVDKSMLAVRPRPGRDENRFVMLETLGSYGRAQLVRRRAEGRWHRAHSLHYGRVVDEAVQGLSGPDEGRWMERLSQDMDNLREARRWALDHDLDAAARLVAALSWYRYRTVRTELELWAEETAQRVPDHPLTPLLLGSAALGAWSRGELARARRRALAAIAATTGPEQRLARDALGAICLVEGRLHDSLHHFDHAIALDRRAGDRFHEGWCVATQAIVLTHLGRQGDAQRRIEEAGAMAQGLRCPSLRAWVLYVRGECMIESDPERALQLLDRSEALAGEVANQFIASVAGVSAVTVRARRGDPVAVPRLRDLVEELERAGNRTQLWMLLRSLVYVLATRGHHQDAAVLQAALAASTTAADPYGPDHERLARASEAVAAASPAGDLERWIDQGRAMDDQEAIAFAIDAIDRALAAGG